MTIKEVERGTIIYKPGQKLEEVLLISKGFVEVRFPGGSYVLHTGDVIGLSEISFEETYLEYVATDKCTLIAYPYDKENMVSVFVGNSETVKYFLTSSFRQINAMLGQQKHLKEECGALHSYLEECRKEYLNLCEKHQIPPEELAGYQDIADFSSQKKVPAWINGYYATLEQMLTIWDHNRTDMDFACGFLSRASEDIHGLIELCGEMQDYKDQICRSLMSENDLDLFGLYTSVYYRLMKRQGAEKEEATALKTAMKNILMQLETQGYEKLDFYKRRKEEFEKLVENCENLSAGKEQDEEQTHQQLKEISGSLDRILAYADCGKELDFAFRQNLLKYKKLENKTGTEEPVRILRRELTTAFYQIYTAALQHSVGQPQVPTVLKMFFNFGYVDEELAGLQNALYLYQIVDHLPTDPANGVYSFYEWLMAIYKGEKEPGRNEFDMDYTEYLREMKRTGKITPEDEKRLLSSNSNKVLYELENVFPLVNKMTYGRVSTFCPLFSEHDVLKPLDTSLVSAEKIAKVFGAVRKIDYSAYYRQTVYTGPFDSLSREFIDVEILPDVILTPNIGNRGVMWQEIEGKRRTTPARMMCSVFLVEDLTMTLVRLTAEFRWEMCKRVQGGRWNDVSEPSLTSEYFDYIQFYKKNSDLSPAAKDKLKNDITRARNSFKEMFVRDYLLWILYESTGSPRLNKVARNILFTYCPFSKGIREKLAINPMYKEVMERYDTRMGQKKHRMENLCQKLKAQGKQIPAEIERQRAYLEM